MPKMNEEDDPEDINLPEDTPQELEAGNKNLNPTLFD